MGALAVKDYFLLFLIGLWFAGVVIFMYKKRKAGECIGCSHSCSGCHKACSRNAAYGSKGHSMQK